MLSRVHETIHCLLVDVSYMWCSQNLHTKGKKRKERATAADLYMMALVGQQKCADKR